VFAISYMSANEVARQLGHAMTEGWGQGDRAANDHYRSIGTYRERIDELFGRARALGFDAIDLWMAHLNPAWATDAHVEIVIDRLAAHRLRIASLAWWIGGTPRELEAACRLAVALGRPLIGGGMSVEGDGRRRLVELLERHDLRFGLENHPERTPDEVLGRITDLGERVGATVDTGWFGTHG
jgi:L-ribulose-5-phosphate 3-epimerase